MFQNSIFPARQSCRNFREYRIIYVKVLAKERASLDELNVLEDEIAKLAGKVYEIESENRIQEKLSDDEMKL